ncbi:hypothetical protein R5R35_003329 [Gryllus longicercus]|uniref:Myb-like domain-containing protein n=1 Tax=Gryllus longicercus TaxID=2509291 RepID=A0AAN9VFD2_9ORTH
MLPSVPLVVTSSRDSSKVSDVEGEKAKCESVPKPHASVSQIITTSAKTNCPSKGSTQADRTEERLSDKVLRNIAPIPVAIVCIPDIPNVRESEVETTEKQKVESKSADEVTFKTVGVGSTAKSEKDKEADNPKSKKPNTTGRSPPKFVKKKPKQIRDLEKTLNCLLSDNEQIKDEKAFAFAQSYFLKVTETLHGKDDATYSEFMRTMNDFGVTIFDATELYKKVTNIFEKYPDLSEEFLAFLLPEQAMQCGKFMEYIILTKMRSFCRKLELYYSKQPSHLRKIYSSLSTLASNNKASVDDLKNTILPLIRNNTLLVNMFLELMPTEAPHASSLTDYESMDFCSVDIQNPKYEDWFETVEIPPPAEDDMYGGEDCICPCHIPPEGKEERHSVHCMSCGTKFVQGRVYLHSGNMLRPARISFKEMKTKAIERLCVKNLKTRRKIDKNRAPPSGSKKNNPSKGETSSTNVSGVSNKLSSPKSSKKAAKGKSTNENPKKANETLSASKASHDKELSNEKKKSKPPRKRLKLMANSDKNPSTSTSIQTLVVSAKKGAPQTGKVARKVDAKRSKGAPQFPLQQAEPTRRAARSAARNATLANDVNQKPNRRNIGKSLKEETDTALATVILSKKGKEECPLTYKSTSSTPLSIEQEKEGTPSKLLSENMIIEPIKESSLEENVVKDDFEIQDDVQNYQSPTDQNSNLPVPDTDGEILCKKDMNPIPFEKEKNDCNEMMKSENRDEKISSEKTSAFDSLAENECPVQCFSTSGDDSSSDGAALEDKTEGFAYSEEHFSQSEGDDVKSETIELDISFENVSSEDDKNILGSEDFPINSSSDSEDEDNYPMECEDSEEMDDCTRLSQDVNMDTFNEENCPNDANDVSVTEQLESAPWTRDEDKIILRTFQSVNNSENVFQKICYELPSRTAAEVQCRFQTLMSFLQKMTDC